MNTLVVDDDVGFCQRVKCLLASEPDIEVIGEAVDGGPPVFWRAWLGKYAERVCSASDTRFGQKVPRWGPCCAAGAKEVVNGGCGETSVEAEFMSREQLSGGWGDLRRRIAELEPVTADGAGTDEWGEDAPAQGRPRLTWASVELRRRNSGLVARRLERGKRS